VVVWMLAACGRVGFDPLAGAPDAAVGADGRDGAGADALPADLVAYFPLDGTLVDLVGGPAGMCSAVECPVAQVAGHLSAAMRFDGIDDCVSIQDVGQFDQANITISIWANEDGPLAARECQVSKRVDVGATPLNSWQLETTGTAAQEAFTSNHGGPGNDQIPSSLTSIQPGVWQHIVATYDGLNERLYIDGVQASGAGNSSPLNYDSNPGIIGCDDNGGASEHFAGMLDELRIYNRALSPAEAQALP